MKNKNVGAKFINLAPKFLAVLYILFISIFALDVFKEYSFPRVLIAFIIHLIPSLALLVITIIAWKRPKLGGVGFLLLALGFTIFFQTYQDIAGIIILTVMPLLTGFLFLANGLFKSTKD